MPGLDMTSFDAALKVHYTSDSIANMCYEDHPFLAMVPKYTKFGGKNLPIPIKYGMTGGRSATYAKARANKSASKYEDFILTRSKDYSLADIDGETIDASQGDANAFMEAMSSEIDAAIESAGRSLSTALFRDGTGAIGRVNNSSFATAVCTLGDGAGAALADDVVNFEAGMVCVFSGDLSTLRDSGDILTVVGVDRVLGTVTFSANLSGISGIAQNDYILVEGDLNAKVKGLASWIVYGTVTSTPFYGVDRTVDRTRLAGVAFDGSAGSIEEALIGGGSLVSREGGKPSHVFLNYSRWTDLQNALGSKVQYIEHNVGDIGFRGIRLGMPKGFVDVYADADCQYNRAYLLDMRWWKFYSLGEAPKLLMADGNKVLRNGDADSYEVRVGYYGALGCRAPGFNAVINLPV